MTFARLLARMMMVPLGLICAILAAGIFLSFAVITMEPVPNVEPNAHALFTLVSGVALASLFSSIAFIPAITGLILAELLAVRSLWVYLAFGLVLSLFAFHAPYEPIDDLAIALDVRAMASGLIAGFVYWLVAGRGAGIVKRTLDNKPKAL